MTTDVRAATLLELHAVCRLDDERLETERRCRIAAIRQRLHAVSGWPWTCLDRRTQSGRGQIEIHRRGGVSYTLIARVLRSGRNPAGDAELIGNAAADLAYLLDQVDRLTAERDVLLAGADNQTRIAYYKVRGDARQKEIRERHR